MGGPPGDGDVGTGGSGGNVGGGGSAGSGPDFAGDFSGLPSPDMSGNSLADAIHGSDNGDTVYGGYDFAADYGYESQPEQDEPEQNFFEAAKAKAKGYLTGLDPIIANMMDSVLPLRGGAMAAAVLDGLTGLIGGEPDLNAGNVGDQAGPGDPEEKMLTNLILETVKPQTAAEKLGLPSIPKLDYNRYRTVNLPKIYGV